MTQKTELPRVIYPTGERPRPVSRTYQTNPKDLTNIYIVYEAENQKQDLVSTFYIEGDGPFDMYYVCTPEHTCHYIVGLERRERVWTSTISNGNVTFTALTNKEQFTDIDPYKAFARLWRLSNDRLPQP